MKTIQIKSIVLLNFKGLRNLSVNFDRNTNIYGDNAKGKTTIFDAFTWLLFGKDSSDRKDFEIKTLDSRNNVIPKIEHEVQAVIQVGEEDITIKRVLRENWVKKRGALETEFAGNVTEYFWNDVPMQQKEFQSKVSSILDETVFKMITNPLAFNSMKWQDRRAALMAIAGSISDQELANGNSEYEKLIAQLVNGKTLDDYRKQIAASIKKAKDEIKAIPTRIDEVSRTAPEVYNFDEIRKYIETKNNELAEVEGLITNKSAAFDSMLAENESKKRILSTLKFDIQNIELAAMNQAKQQTKPDTSVLDGLKTQLGRLTDEKQAGSNTLSTLESKRNAIEAELVRLEEKIQGKRNEWNLENAKEISFDENAFHCPTCKRDFEAGDVDAKKLEMTTNFKKAKTDRLNEINTQGKSLSETKANQQTELNEIQERITKGKLFLENLDIEIKTLNGEIESESSKESTLQDPVVIYETILKANTDYAAKQKELEAAQANIVDVPEVDTSELKAKKSAIVFELDTLKAKLRNEDQLKSINERIASLEKEEQTLAQQISNVEKEQFVIENFNKLKIDTLEAKINAKFKFVNFKMFQTQINGGESECCDALINGVPFSDANTASKINAGLDIINTLCEFYQVTAPIFIDNRESIVQLIPSESQIVNLIVWEGSELNVGSPKVNGLEIQKQLELV